MKTHILAAMLFCAAVLTPKASAAIKTEVIDYTDGGVELQGYLAYDDTLTTPRPGVLIIHEWWGHNEYVHKRAEQLAELGYVAFALDMYGKGVTAKTPEEAGKLAGQFYKDRALMRSRASAGMQILQFHVNLMKKRAVVDEKKIAAIGYCFGGSTAIELARGGADLVGVVGFHAGLDFPVAEDAKNIKGKLLLCTGADDPMVTPDKVNAFEQQLKAANVDYEINVYGGAVHAFTNPGADAHNMPGVKYNEKADKRSFQAMKDFFAEIFK